MAKMSVFAKKGLQLLCFFVFFVCPFWCSQPEVPDSNAPGGNAGNNTPPSVSPVKTSDDALECNWLLKVDQTIPITEDELTVNYTLVLIAQKNGGKDVYGTYEGAAFIGSELDASNLSTVTLR